MNVRAVSLVILSLAASSAVALGGDLAAPPAPAQAKAYSIEIFDRNKTLKIACGALGFQSRPQSVSDGKDFNFAQCSILDGRATQELVNYAGEGKRLEKVLISFGQQKGHTYKMELLNAVLWNVEFRLPGSNTPDAALNFHASESRLMRDPG